MPSAARGATGRVPELVETGLDVARRHGDDRSVAQLAGALAGYREHQGSPEAAGRWRVSFEAALRAELFPLGREVGRQIQGKALAAGALVELAIDLNNVTAARSVLRDMDGPGLSIGGEAAERARADLARRIADHWGHA